LPLSPVFLLAAIGFHRMWKDRALRLEWSVCLAVVAYYLLFNASYYLWDGGWSLGPRHVIPMLPFLSMGLLHLSAFPEVLCTGVLAVSAVHMLMGTSVWPLVPSMYPNELLDYVYPRFFGLMPQAQLVHQNVGYLIGLRGPATLAPLALVWVLLGAAVTSRIRAVNHQRK
jgi:hypothetical protein